MTPLPAELRTRLRDVRVRKGLSLKRVGNALDRSGEAVRLWEVGKCQPSDSDLDAWTLLLGVAIPEGVTGWTLAPAPPCGTDRAYQRHHKRREPIDDACRRAHTATQRAQRNRRKDRCTIH